MTQDICRSVRNYVDEYLEPISGRLLPARRAVGIAVALRMFAFPGNAFLQRNLAAFDPIAYRIDKRGTDKRKQKSSAQTVLFPALVDCLFQLLIMHGRLELFGSLTDFQRDIEADAQIGEKNTVKDSHKKSMPVVPAAQTAAIFSGSYKK